MSQPQEISVTLDTDHPYSAEGFLLVPGGNVVVIVGDDEADPSKHGGPGRIVATADEFAKFQKNPGVRARVASGKLKLGGSAAAPEPQKPANPALPNVGEMTVDEVRELVGGISDVAVLQQLHDAEAGGKNRTTAKEAIDDRINALK